MFKVKFILNVKMSEGVTSSHWYKNGSDNTEKYALGSAHERLKEAK